MCIFFAMHFFSNVCHFLKSYKKCIENTKIHFKKQK